MEAGQAQELVAVLEVLVEALLQHRAEGLPELGVVLGLLRLATELVEDPLDQPGAHFRQPRVVLEGLAADVERQVLRVDDAAQEAQVGRQQPLAVVGDEHPADVELHLRLALRIEQVEGRGRGDEQQAGVGDDALDGVVHHQPRVVEGMADVVVELRVLLVGDVLLRPGPQRRGRVQRLLGGFRFAFRLAALLGPAVDEHDRKADVVGVGLDDLAQPGGFEELVLAVLQVKDDGGAPAGPLGVLDAEGALAVGGPPPRPVLAGAPGDHVHRVGDHEGRVEADAELADQRHVLLGVAGELGEEALGSRAGDGAKRLHQVVVVHADAVVGHRQRPLGTVDVEGDLELGLALGQRRIGQRRIAQPVAGVRGVGDELAEKNLLMGVERVGDDIQKPADFRLKSECFPSHGVGSTPCV